MGYVNDRLKCNNSEFGNTVRDKLLQLQLDNDVAAKVKVSYSEDRASVTVTLLSKTGKELSKSDPIIVDPVGNRVVTNLDLAEQEGHPLGKVLRLTFAGETTTEPKYIYCPLDELYTKINNNTAAINTKQDKLVSGTNIKTINGNDILGAGDLEIKAGVSSVNTKTGDVILKTSDLDNDSNYITKDYHDTAKQDKLVSSTNIKTINGVTILGPGNMNIDGSISQYQELATAALNNLNEAGVYKIANAIDAPTNTAVDGVLDVKALTDGKARQDWMSSTNRAIRVLGAAPTLEFYVNENLKPQGDIYLPAGETYVLRGDLKGSIIIGNGSETTDHRTKLILNGVNIQTTSQYAAIQYKDLSSKLVIEFRDNIDKPGNYLVVDRDEPKADDDFGVIHSENNLVIQGNGYLTIQNKKGHGIKASELIINGDPHIYIDSKHDAVHGGHLLKITGGHFKVVNCNDAFSSSAGSLNDGQMLILGGEFNIVKCAQAAFDAKSLNGKKQFLGNAKIILGEQVTQAFTVASGATEQFKLYNGLVTIENEYGKVVPEYVNLADQYSTAKIIFNGEEVLPTNNKYTLNPVGKDDYYAMSGNFSNYTVVCKSNSASAAEYFNFNVNGIYYVNNSDTESIFFEHQPYSKRIKLKFVENSLSYIHNKNGKAFSTNRSYQFTSKGDLIVECTNGYAVYAKDGYCLLSGDGLRKFVNSKYGIYSTSIRLGEDPEDIDDKKYGNSDDAIYVIGNSEKDIIIAKQNTSSPVAYEEQIIATQYHAGMSLIGNIAADTGVTGHIYAKSGVVHPSSTGTDFNNTAYLYAKESATVIPDENVIAYEAIEGYNETIPPLTPGETSPWTVYSSGSVDAYTKAESDAKFALKTQVTALEETIAKQQSLIKSLEDRFAHELYATYPYITYTTTEGLNPVVVRGNSGKIDDPVLTDGSHTVTIDKESGLYTKGTGVVEKNNGAQVNIIITCHEGKKAYAVGSDSSKYKNIKFDEVYDAATNKYRIQCTQVAGDFTLTISEVDK